MKKLVMMFLLFFITDVESCLHAMEKPVEAKSQVEDVNKAPQDVQNKAAWVKDNSFKASSSKDVNTVINDNNNQLKDLHGLDAIVQPTPSGSIFDPASTFKLDDNSSLTTNFASTTGRPTRSELIQTDGKNSEIIHSKVMTQYNLDGSMTENIFKNQPSLLKSQNLVQSSMIEYKKDGSFTITNYAQDGKMPIDRTTFKANVKSQVEAEELTDYEKIILNKFPEKSAAYARNRTQENAKDLSASVVDAVIETEKVPVTSKQKTQLTEAAEQLLSQVDTNNPNWFTDFVKMVWDSIAKLFKFSTNAAVDVVSQSSQSGQANSPVPTSSSDSVNLLEAQKTSPVSAVSSSSTPEELFQKLKLVSKEEPIEDQKQQLQAPESPASVQQSLFSEPLSEQVFTEPSQSQVAPLSINVQIDTVSNISTTSVPVETEKSSVPVKKQKQTGLAGKRNWANKRLKELTQKGQNLVSSISSQVVPQAVL